MIWIYAAVFVLIALLVIPNALYAFRKFLENRNLLLFVVYLGFLALLTYLVLHVTNRTTELAERAQNVYLEIDGG